MSNAGYYASLEVCHATNCAVARDYPAHGLWLFPNHDADTRAHSPGSSSSHSFAANLDSVASDSHNHARAIGDSTAPNTHPNPSDQHAPTSANQHRDPGDGHRDGDSGSSVFYADPAHRCANSADFDENPADRRAGRCPHCGADCSSRRDPGPAASQTVLQDLYDRQGLWRYLHQPQLYVPNTTRLRL